MINVRINSNAKRMTVQAELNDSPKNILEVNKALPNNAVVNMDGAPLQAGEMNKTFADLNVPDGSTISLTSVVKADAAC